MANGEEIVLRFRTESDLRAGEAAQKHLAAALKSVKEGTPAYAALKVHLDAVNASLGGQSAAALRASVDLQKAITATKAAGGNTGAMQGQLNALRSANGLQAPGMLAGAANALSAVPGMGGLASFATGPAGAAAGVAAGMGLAIREYAQAEEGVAKLDAAMAQNGILTTANRERYQELAGELQKTTAIADDEWIGVLTRLTQFGSDPKTVGVDVEAVKNLAGLMGGDVQSAAQAYSKALQGSFDMFARYGIIIDDAGTKTEKLTKLQELLAQRGGGQLEASAKTINGQFRSLKLATSDVFEGFGRLFASTGFGQSVLYGFAKTAEGLASAIGGVIPAVDGLKNSTDAMATATAAAEAAEGKHKEALEGITRALENSNTALSKNLGLLAKEKAAADEIAAAQLALAEARIKADGSLSKEQRETAIKELRAGAERAGEKRNVELKKQQLALLDKGDISDAAATTEADAQVESAQKRLQQEQAADSVKRAEALHKEAVEKTKSLMPRVWKDEDGRDQVTTSDPELVRQAEADEQQKRRLMERVKREASPVIGENFTPMGVTAAESELKARRDEAKKLATELPKRAEERNAQKAELRRELNTASIVNPLNEAKRVVEGAAAVKVQPKDDPRAVRLTEEQFATLQATRAAADSARQQKQAAELLAGQMKAAAILLQRAAENTAEMQRAAATLAAAGNNSRH